MFNLGKATPYIKDSLAFYSCRVYHSHPVTIAPDHMLFLSVELSCALWIQRGSLYWTITCTFSQGLRPDLHKDEQEETPAAVNPLIELVNVFKAALNPTPPPPPASGCPMAMPATFAGEAAECSGFLPDAITTVSFGERQSRFPHLTTNRTATGTLTTSDQLLRLQQGTSSSNEYTLHFRTLAAASGWNEVALLGTYRQGLNLEIRADMALYDDSIGLESFLQRATRDSQQLPLITAPQSVSVAASFPVPEPMQVDSTRLSWTEQNRRITLGLCFYCGQQGHLIRTCPIRPPHPVLSTIQSEVETASLTLLPVTLHTPDCSLSLSALVDSGSSDNFISQECLNQLQLSCHHHHQVYAVKTIQGKPLGHGKVRHSSPYITLQVGLLHIEEIKFLVLEESTVSIILGRPWLRLHRPECCWDPCDIIHWSQMCYTQCLSILPHPHSVPALVASTRVESPEPAFTPEIPAEYMAFQDVFSKQAATYLPPHRPWDCAIDLLPGAQLPKGRVSRLSILECQAMEEYIAEGLNQGFIRPSTSPATSSFFFMGKKDGGLRPCIDYRQLNSQILQQPHPLPLVPAALKELRGAQVFTKLDLWSAYNLVHIRAGDEWKTTFVTPTGHYEYQVMKYGLSISPSVFQTFINEVFREFLHRLVVVYIDDILIYSRNMAEHRQHVQQVLHKLCQHHLYLKLEKCEFNKPSVQFLGYNISAEGVLMDQGKDYSSITAPLTSLLRGKPKHLTWSPAAHEAFQHLKHIFSTAPLLHHPDPELPFTVEVDASTTGVGAVLSQAVGEPSILHPCAFHSRKLSPAEQNYDVGNDITKTFNTFEKLRDSTPDKHVGSKNIPGDALSHQSSSEHHTDPEPIIPPNRIVSPIVWNQDQDIQHATLQEPAPPECPEGKIYVPRSQRQNLLGTAHQSPGSGHPGTKQTLSLLQTRYWWPSMRRDTIRYVQSCSVCAMSNSPRMLPTGKLVPLPILERPWSHLGVDFVTDLPSSEDNTCDCRSFLKILQVCSTKGIANSYSDCRTSFPTGVPSLWHPGGNCVGPGPIISHVWKAFFKLLGITVNLSSGYHPQTHGQTERKIQELGHNLRPYCCKDQHSWSNFLPWAEYAQNSLHQDTTSITPFQCVLGYQPPLFPWTEEPSNVPAVDHWFRESKRVWDSAHHHLQRAVRRNKHFADARLWLSTRDLRLRLPCHKLSPRYIGPFKILRQINDVFALSSFSSLPETPGAEAEPSPPEVLDQTSIYTVHKILDSRRQGGHLEHLIDWEGYGPEERSWVPRDDVLDPILLADFHCNHVVVAVLGVVLRRREPPLEGGVVSGIHHSHLHLPRHPEHCPPAHHHLSSNHLHPISISHTLYKAFHSCRVYRSHPVTTASDHMLFLFVELSCALWIQRGSLYWTITCTFSQGLVVSPTHCDSVKFKAQKAVLICPTYRD
ncbi:Transposon Tf2-8 polyprotein [Labeo rohita]|uniref:Gypsy retrotransposon integrase-like protein 1 n=1 Tax=Labeo rohita TaxID=84645 RepID=A0ABQ8LYY0_LABRO|nr:Transposon Tf2-8 polyprotein [Labeo rohita]